jgi:hypothetical protein
MVLSVATTGCIPNRVSSKSVATARQKWSAAAITDYSFSLSISAFTLERNCSVDGEIKVVVAAGQTTKYGTCDVQDPRATANGSIPALFNGIETASSEKVPELEAEFDPVLGYPRSIWINYDRWKTDHSVRLTIRDFQALKPAS